LGDRVPADHLRPEERIAGYDAVIARHGGVATLDARTDEAPPPGTLQLLIDGLLIAAYAAYDTGDHGASLQLYDELVRRYGRETALEARATVADAIAAKATTLGRDGQIERAIEVYDGLLARLGDATEPELRERVADALCGRGDWLQAGGRAQDALADYRAVLERFAEHETPLPRRADPPRVRRRRRAGGGLHLSPAGGLRGQVARRDQPGDRVGQRPLDGRWLDAELLARA
jgi:tetratricopeptide (TPR) repeat protein